MKAHRTDWASLVFGLLFLLLAGWWAVAQLSGLNLPEPGWLVAGALILFGLLGLLGAVRSARSAPPPPPVADTTVDDLYPVRDSEER